MKSHYAWAPCPLLLAYCEKPKLAKTSSKELPLLSLHSVRAEEEGKSNSLKTLRDALGATRRNKSREVSEKRSVELAWNAVETDLNYAGEIIRQMPADHREKMRLVLHYAVSLAAREPGLGIIVSQWTKSEPAAAFNSMYALRDEVLHKEAVFAMKMPFRQQSHDMREDWLKTADSKTRADLEAHCKLAMKEIGDNVSPMFSYFQYWGSSNNYRGMGSSKICFLSPRRERASLFS
jgi:hypothetical protein